MKPCIKRRPFFPRSSAPRKSGLSSGDAALGLELLDKVSVFETLRAYRGRIFRCERHARRLRDSCASLGRLLPLSEKELCRWLEVSLKESGLAEAVLRVSVHWSGEKEGEFLLFLRPFGAHPAEWYENGVQLRSAAGRRPSPKAQDPQIKASQYVNGVLAYLDKGELPAHEMLFLGPDGTVAEGTVSNIFIVRPALAHEVGGVRGRKGGVKEKSLLTPSVGSGILRGVTRDFVLELAKKRGLPVVETVLTRHDLYTSDECFMTNTSSELLPVVGIDGRKIGNGRPGRLTQLLGNDFRRNR